MHERRKVCCQQQSPEAFHQVKTVMMLMVAHRATEPKPIKKQKNWLMLLSHSKVGVLGKDGREYSCQLISFANLQQCRQLI